MIEPWPLSAYDQKAKPKPKSCNRKDSECVSVSGKIILLGDSGVGKTTLFWRLVSASCTSGVTRPTCVPDAKFIRVSANNVDALFHLWDTAGSERFWSVTQSFFREAQAIFLLYDVTNQTSFASLDRWLARIDKDYSPRPLVFVVANKTDLSALQRVVSSEQGREWALKRMLSYIEISALNGQNSAELLQAVAKHLSTMHTSASKKLPSSSHMIRLDSSDEDEIEQQQKAVLLEKEDTTNGTWCSRC